MLGQQALEKNDKVFKFEKNLTPTTAARGGRIRLARQQTPLCVLELSILAAISQYGLAKCVALSVLLFAKLAGNTKQPRASRARLRSGTVQAARGSFVRAIETVCC